MACWLCRLTSEEFEQCNDWVGEARELGVNAWVVSAEAQGSVLTQADLLRNLAEQPNGLPFALEWCITEPLSLEAEHEALVAILPWLQHLRVYRQGARPLLMIRGIEQCIDSRSIAGRIRQMFLAGGCGPQPLLVASCLVPVDGFDGSYEHIQLPKQSADRSKRADFECHLRDAHWHAPPNGWLIPAVLALEKQHQDCYRNANAARYREWLSLMSHWSVLQQNGDSMAPVLLESWSGHRRWWSASLPNSSEPLETSPASEVQELQWGQTAAEHLALMVHGFYLDGLDSMLQRLDPQSVPALDLYVSTPIRQVHAVAALLRRQGWPRVRLFGVPNRGRDLAPFIRHLLPAALSVGHHAFIKVHTKSSPHLADGQGWGDHLINSMLNDKLIDELQDRLSSNSELGLLAPAGTVVPITFSCTTWASLSCFAASI